jgi:hypothetical protein
VASGYLRIAAFNTSRTNCGIGALAFAACAISRRLQEPQSSESVRGHAPAFRILQEEGVERYTQLTNIARTSRRMTVAVLRRQLFGRHVAVLNDVIDDGPGALGCDGLEPF